MNYALDHHLAKTAGMIDSKKTQSFSNGNSIQIQSIQIKTTEQQTRPGLLQSEGPSQQCKVSHKVGRLLKGHMHTHTHISEKSMPASNTKRLLCAKMNAYC